MIYRVSAALVYCYFKLFYNIKIEGREFIPKKDPFILAANHLSSLDPPLLAIFSRRKLGFLAKEELFTNKISALYFKNIGLTPVKRGQVDIRAMRLALKTLKSKPLVIFPQGTRGVSLEAANSGVGFLCKKAKVRIIAARIYGTEQRSFKGVSVFNRVKIRVVFARVDNIEEGDNYDQITRKVMDKIKSL